MSAFDLVLAELRQQPKRWLVTGAAGFIGSNLVEALLRLDQEVVGLDNFATGHARNLEEIQQEVPARQWARFTFVQGDICQLKDCRSAFLHGKKIGYVLHQAALGSVPRSLADPITTNRSNVDGFLHMLVAARDAGVERFVYAASSSTYGDHPGLPKVEEMIGRPLSPYAVTKYVNELYADVFSREYGLKTIGLRYFNVFGPRQDPNGAYAAVIPRWISGILTGADITINGDGETSRDFCYVDNVVQANLLAATSNVAANEVFNVAFHARTSLNELVLLLKAAVEVRGIGFRSKVIHTEFRSGDVRHSLADITKARRLLGYEPTDDVRSGLHKAMPWYLSHSGNAGA